MVTSFKGKSKVRIVLLILVNQVANQVNQSQLNILYQLFSLFAWQAAEVGAFVTAAQSGCRSESSLEVKTPSFEAPHVRLCTNGTSPAKR